MGIPIWLVGVTTAATFCNVAFGFDIGVVSGSLADLAASLNLTTIEQEAATSGLNFMSGVGAIVVSGTLLDTLGRRKTLLTAAVLLFLGSITVASAYSFAQLLAGRALQGLGSGCSLVACSVYITELAPTQYRGALVSVADVSINFGILLGYALDFAVHSHFPSSSSSSADLHWRVSMALTVIMPSCYIACYPWIPESPRFLVSKGYCAEALAVLRKTSTNEGVSVPSPSNTYTSTTPPSKTPEQELAAIKIALASEAKPSWKEALCPPSKGGRWKVAVALLLGLSQQLTGTEAILYYAPKLFKGFSMTRLFYANLGIGMCKFVGELVATGLADTVGRRRPIIWGTLLLSVCVMGIAESFAWTAAHGGDGNGTLSTDGAHPHDHHYGIVNNNVARTNDGYNTSHTYAADHAASAADYFGPASGTAFGNASGGGIGNGGTTVSIVLLCAIMFFFSIGAGPFTLVVVNEMIPFQARSKVVAASVLCNRLGSGTVALTFLSLSARIRVPATFYLYGGLGFAVTIFYMAVLPEGTGLSLEQSAATPNDGGGEGRGGSRRQQEREAEVLLINDA
eukprot:gene12985-23265_t